MALGQTGERHPWISFFVRPCSLEHTRWRVLRVWLDAFQWVPGQSGAASQHAKRSWQTQCGIAPWHRPEQYSTSCGCHDDDTNARALWSILDLASTVWAQRLFSCCR